MSDVDDALIPLEFANREQETQIILNKSHSLVLVDAPAGYGKTALFEEVRKRCERDDCKCPIIDLSKHKGKETIKNEIAKSVGVSVITDRNLIGAMGRFNIILMLDSIEQAKPTDLRWLLTQFIPACREAIKGTAFRVLVSSRYGSVKLENGNNIEDLPAILKTYYPVYLSPLSQEVVEQVLKNKTKDPKNPNPPKGQINEQDYAEWSQHFMRLSGGHPRSIQKLVTELVNKNYAINFRNDEKVLFEDLIAGEVDIITHDLETKEKKALEVLSIFRIIHLGVVSALQNESLPPKISFPGGAETIIRRLTEIGLLKRHTNSPFYSDAIVKNLILARMKIMTPQTYREMNCIAQKIYDKWIKDILESPGNQYSLFDRADLILIYVKESIYHYIQRFFHKDLSLEDIAPYLRGHSENLLAFWPDRGDSHRKQQLESILLDEDILLALKEHGLDPDKVLQKAFEPNAIPPITETNGDITPIDRKLCVFICHASQDKPIVRKIHKRLLAKGWVEPWLDEEKLLPGQEWERKIKEAVRVSDVVIVCLSNNLVTKEGFVQKELRVVLEVSDEKPDETIYVLPLRLDDCGVPDRLRKWQYVDYFPKANEAQALKMIFKSLEERQKNLPQK